MTLISRYMSLIKFEHTIFALPFALISLLVASGGRPSLRVLLWVVVAMVGARSAAMAFNRVADWKIDAANPRTADRHIPAGAISVAGAWMFVVLSAALLVLAAWMLNPLCFRLSPVALAVVLGYSYMKRVSPLAHVVLGLGLAIAPVGAWLAVTGAFASFPLLLAAGVMFWVAGFDTIYGCQDVDFDRQAGLHSLASRLGVDRALVMSRVFHPGAGDVPRVPQFVGGLHDQRDAARPRARLGFPGRRGDHGGVAHLGAGHRPRGGHAAHRQGVFRDQFVGGDDIVGCCGGRPLPGVRGRSMKRK